MQRERWEWCDARSLGRDGGRFRPRSDRRRRLRGGGRPARPDRGLGRRPARIEAELAKAPAAPRDRMPIVHASQVIGMEEKPVEALRKKRDNSISRCWGLMAAGEVEAVVSAGNTGAMVASALFNAKMFLPGVRRPGIAAIFPSHQGPIVIIDVGANMNAKAEDLYQYGIMGAIYAEEILGVTVARIGLLNVGTEDEKGTELTRNTFDLYQASPWAVAVRRQRRGPRHLRGPRAGRHLRRVRGQRPAQGRRGGRRVPLLGAQGGAGPLDARPARRRRPEDRRQPQATQDAVRVRGVRRRPRCWASAAPASSATAPPESRAIKNALRVAGTMAADRLQQPDRRAAWRCRAAAVGRLVTEGREGDTPMAKIAFLFPGQGAQAVGMCRELDQELPGGPASCSTGPARSSGIDLERLCIEGPAEALEATDVSQPAIFVASLAALESLKASQPDLVAACAGRGRAEPGRIHGPGRSPARSISSRACRWSAAAARRCRPPPSPRPAA